MYRDDDYERYDNRAAPPTGKRRRRGMPTWGIVLLVLAVPVGLIGLVVGAGALFLFTAKTEPVNAADRAVLLTAKELDGQLEDFSYDPSKETITKQKFLDDSYDVDYEYDSDSLYLNCTVTVDPNASDAQTSFTAMWAGTKIGLRFDSDVEVVPQDDWLRWGDASRFATLKTNGEPFGHMLIVRKGKHVFYLAMTGIVFEDSKQLNEFILPTLSRLTGYHP